MALNFPSNPSQGAIYNAPSGVEYIYDGAKWVSGGSASGGLVPGDNVSLLTNDAGYITLDDVPAADPNNVVSDEVPTFTVTVQTTERTITSGSFDLSTGNHWTCGAISVPNPTNAVAGTSGLIRLTAAPTWGSAFKFPGGSAPSISAFPSIIPFYVAGPSIILMGNVVEGIS